MPPPSEHAQAIVDRVDDVVAVDLEVVAATEVTASLRSVLLRGDVGTLRPHPGQDVMVSVLDAAGRHRWRRYTIRHLVDDTLELWITLDTGGPGAAWARGARPGQLVEVVGPRGKIRIDDRAEAHVFVVDESGLAAAFSMAEALEAPARLHLVASHLASVDGPRTAPGVVATFAAMPTTSPTSCDTDALADELARRLAPATWVPLEHTAGYVFGELGLTRDVRGVLEALGVSDARLAVKPYWRAGQANEDRGEPSRA